MGEGETVRKDVSVLHGYRTAQRPETAFAPHSPNGGGGLPFPTERSSPSAGGCERPDGLRHGAGMHSAWVRDAGAG